MIVPAPRCRMARPAAALSISTALIITSMACSCGVVSAAVSLARTPKPALLTMRSIGCSALANRSAIWPLVAPVPSRRSTSNSRAVKNCRSRPAENERPAADQTDRRVDGSALEPDDPRIAADLYGLEVLPAVAPQTEVELVSGNDLLDRVGVAVELVALAALRGMGLIR